MFFGFGHSYFYRPSHYRDYCDPDSLYYDPRYCKCDPYSPYYDPRYCKGYSPSSGTNAYSAGRPLTATNPAAAAGVVASTPTAPEVEFSMGDIPDGVVARVPLISIPDPPDALP